MCSFFLSFFFVSRAYFFIDMADILKITVSLTSKLLKKPFLSKGETACFYCGIKTCCKCSLWEIRGRLIPKLFYKVTSDRQQQPKKKKKTENPAQTVVQLITVTIKCCFSAAADCPGSARQGLDSGCLEWCVCVCVCVVKTIVHGAMITVCLPNLSDGWRLEWTDAQRTLQYNPIEWAVAGQG